MAYKMTVSVVIPSANNGFSGSVTARIIDSDDVVAFNFKTPELSDIQANAITVGFVKRFYIVAAGKRNQDQLVKALNVEANNLRNGIYATHRVIKAVKHNRESDCIYNNKAMLNKIIIAWALAESAYVKTDMMALYPSVFKDKKLLTEFSEKWGSLSSKERKKIINDGFFKAALKIVAFRQPQ